MELTKRQIEAIFKSCLMIFIIIFIGFLIAVFVFIAK